MDISTVKELAELMKVNDLSRLELEENDTKIILERLSQISVQTPMPMQAVNTVQDIATVNQNNKCLPAEEKGLITIKSPMVGVFYEAPAPGEKPYASVGDSIGKGDVLCIVEAMKLMNEINSEYSGVVVEVCATNGQVVEFDQPLFRLRCENE